MTNLRKMLKFDDSRPVEMVGWNLRVPLRTVTDEHDHLELLLGMADDILDGSFDGWESMIVDWYHHGEKGGDTDNGEKNYNKSADEFIEALDRYGTLDLSGYKEGGAVMPITRVWDNWDAGRFSALLRFRDDLAELSLGRDRGQHHLDPFLDARVEGSQLLIGTQAYPITIPSKGEETRI